MNRRLPKKKKPIPGPIPQGSVLYEMLERIAESIVAQHQSSKSDDCTADSARSNFDELLSAEGNLDPNQK